MSYQVTFRDKTSTFVDTTRGENLKAALAAGKSQLIDIGGEMYRSSEIVSIKRAMDAPIVDPWANEKQMLPAKPTCRGTRSIQNEINKIAKDSGKDWAKKIRDMVWREKTRQLLRKNDTDWCDYKAGTCVCN